MKNSRNNYFTLIVIYISFFYVVYRYFNTNSLTNVYTTYTGIALMAVSLIFFTLARIKLGSAFQASAEANKLVKDGIYRVIRNPIYIFGFTFIAGLILFMQAYIAFIFLPVIIVMQRKRIKKEEKVLEEEFGDEYIEYKKKLGFNTETNNISIWKQHV